MQNFLKGIIIGLGAVAPGLSGSILLVIFGLYQKTITAISTIFQNFRSNLKFLFPLGAGILIGIILFSKLVDYLLFTWEMQIRFAFLGFILGSIPLFYQEVRKMGFRKIHYLWIAGAFVFGTVLFNFNRHLFPPIQDPNLFQSVLLGLVVATAYIVPGVDSAAILSALGLYELWVHSLATLNFAVLLPAMVGAACGVLAVSYIINLLIAKFYTPTFSMIFGLFLSVIPTILGENCAIGLNWETAVSLLILAVSFVLSLLFSNLEKLRAKTGEESA